MQALDQNGHANEGVRQTINNDERILKLASQSRHAKASAGSQFTFVLSHKAAVFFVA